MLCGLDSADCVRFFVVVVLSWPRVRLLINVYKYNSAFDEVVRSVCCRRQVFPFYLRLFSPQVSQCGVYQFIQLQTTEVELLR